MMMRTPSPAIAVRSDDRNHPLAPASAPAPARPGRLPWQAPVVPRHSAESFRPNLQPTLPVSAVERMAADLSRRAVSPMAGTTRPGRLSGEPIDEAAQVQPAAPVRLPTDAPKVPLQAALRTGGAPAPRVSAPERTAAHLQLRAKDPLAAAGLSPGGRRARLPGAKVGAAPVAAAHDAAGPEVAAHDAAGIEAAAHEGAAPAGAAHEQPVEAALPAERGERASIQMACASDCGCAKCSAAKDESLLQVLGIQREARPGAGPPRVDGGEVRSRLGAGASLPAPVAQTFSSAYGRDLSNVRVHANHALADHLGARAFTVGRDVAFAPGEYRPGTPEGDRLIGHELAHVVQQAGGEGTVQGAGLSEDGYEREADHAADKALAGHRVSRFSAVGRAAVQREEKGLWDRAWDAGEAALDTAADVGNAAVNTAVDVGTAVVDTAVDVGTVVVDTAVDVGTAAVGAAVDLGQAAYETAKDGVLAAIRLVSPGLADFLEDPLGYLETRLLPALQSWVEGLFGVDLSELADDARTAFTELTGTISGVIAGDEKACLAFASAVQKVRYLYDQIKNSAVIKKIASALSSLKSGFDKVSKMVLAPAFDGLRKVAGGAWGVITSVADTVGGWIDTVKQKVSGAIDWISQKLGFADGPGLLDFLRKKAQDIWAKVQKKLEPVATPLKVMVGIFLVMQPATWTYLIFKYGPAVIEAAKWLWAHKDDPNIVKSARAEKRAKLAGILGAVQNIGAAITGVAAKAAGALESGVGAALKLAGAVTGLPILSVTKGVVDKIVKGLKGLASIIGNALKAAGAWVSKVAGKVAEKIAPITHILLKLGTALVNPSAIPVMLAGWAWLKLPDCYKGPIIDLILDALIGILDASPSNPVFGPLWALLKPGIVGFVRQLRKMSTPIKVEASNKIATFMSAGSPQFMLGYVKGLLSGIWDNTAGTIADIVELGHMLQTLVENAVVSAVMGAPAPAAGGTAATAPGAPPAAPVVAAAPEGPVRNEIRKVPVAGGSHEASPAGPGPTPSASPAKVAADTAPSMPEPPEPKLDTGGVTEKEITREELDQYRPKDEGEGGPPPVSQEQFNQEAAQLGKDLKPSASTVAREAGGALKEYFKSKSDMTYDELVAKLGDAWGAAQNLISAQGAKMAREAVAVLLGKGGDFVVGEKVGWIAGMVIVEVVTDVLTGGGAAAAKQAANAAKVAKAATRPAKWTTRALESIVSAFKTAGKFLMEIPKKLQKLAKDAKGAFTRVMNAIRDAGKSIAAFVERLLGRAGKAHVPRKPPALHAPPVPHKAPAPHATPAATKAESKAAAAESKAAKVDEAPAAKPHGEAPHGEAPRETPKEAHGEAGTRAEREASVKESGKVESTELTPHEIDNEIQHISDNPHLIEGEPPKRTAKIGEHTWKENFDGSWCRHSIPDPDACVGPGTIGGEAKAAEVATAPKSVGDHVGGARKTSFETLEDVKALPDNYPDKHGLKHEAEAIRKELDDLHDTAKHASPEELDELVKPELDALNKRMEELRAKLPVKEPGLPQGARPRQSQPGGLDATEGTTIMNPDGTPGPPSHPLKRHGPDADPNWLKKRVGPDEGDAVAKFTDRTVMETTIGDAIDANQPRIAAWLAGPPPPPAGQNIAMSHSPGLGNLGEGFYRVGDDVVPIPSTMPLENVTVVLKSDGKGGYIIQTAYPTF